MLFRSNPILIRDDVYPGVHHLSGTMPVPLSCDDLAVHVVQVTQYSYRIVFETWQNPALTCYKAQTTRDFTVIAFAPTTGTAFAATFDDKPIAVAVVQNVHDTDTNTNTSVR